MGSGKETWTAAAGDPGANTEKRNKNHNELAVNNRRNIANMAKSRGKPFTKGDPRINRSGRPPGSINEKTRYFQEFFKIALERGVHELTMKRIFTAAKIDARKKNNEAAYFEIAQSNALLKEIIRQAPRDLDISSGGEKITSIVDLVNTLNSQGGSIEKEKSVKKKRRTKNKSTGSSRKRKTV